MGKKKRKLKDADTWGAKAKVEQPCLTLEQFLAMLPADDPRRPRVPTGLLVMENGVGVYYQRASRGSVWGQWRYLRQVPEERVLRDVPSTVRSAEPIDPTLTGRNKPSAFGAPSLA